jgi:hypothetical protein
MENISKTKEILLLSLIVLLLIANMAAGTGIFHP